MLDSRLDHAGTPTDARRRTLEQTVDRAARARSVYDTRPWRIEWCADRAVIRADRSRPLPVPDPAGRELMQCVGAALFNVRVALAAGGWAAEIDRLPNGEDPDLIAEVRPFPGPPDAGLAGLGPVLLRRRADRRRFPGGEVPAAVLHLLTEIAGRQDVLLAPVVHESHRRLVARLVDGAAGMPTADQTLVLLATRTDDRPAWLRAGEALQHLWLELTRLHWSASPIPQAIAVPVKRVQLRAALTWDAHPQMLLRIGRAADGAFAPAGPAGSGTA